MGDLERDRHSLESRFQTSHIGQRLESMSRAASFTKGPQDLVPVYSRCVTSGTSHDLSEPKHADAQSRRWRADSSLQQASSENGSEKAVETIRGMCLGHDCRQAAPPGSQWR